VSFSLLWIARHAKKATIAGCPADEALGAGSARFTRSFRDARHATRGEPIVASVGRMRGLLAGRQCHEAITSRAASRVGGS